MVITFLTFSYSSAVGFVSKLIYTNSEECTTSCAPLRKYICDVGKVHAGPSVGDTGYGALCS